jgi:hypothetical protein
MKKVFPIALGVFFLVSLFSMMALRYHYTRNMPRSPQQEARRTVPLNVNYGKTVYITYTEKQIIVVSYIVLAVAGASVLIFVIARVMKLLR